MECSLEGISDHVRFGNLEAALSQEDTQLRLFGKPEVHGRRRMGVALARGDTVDAALAKANKISSLVDVTL